MAEEKNKGQLAGATLDTLHPSDPYATHYSYKGEGGPFQAHNLEGMLSLPILRLRFGCECIVQEDSVNATPTTSYVLKKLPIRKISAPTEDVLELPKPTEWADYETIALSLDQTHEGFFLNFWQVAWRSDTFSGEYDEEFAPDYLGSWYADNNLEVVKQPPFPYTRDAAWHTANWSDAYNTSLHRWKRIKYGNGPWSRPFLIFSKATPGDVPLFSYKWVLTQLGAPALPSFIDASGKLNNTPAGFSDTAPPKPTGDYTLWEIRNIADAFGDIKRPWIGPFKIPLSGNLTRYSTRSHPNPNNIVDTTTDASQGQPGDPLLTAAGWVAEPNGNQKFIARRSDNGDGTYSSWVVDRIAQEGVEVRNFIYRNFPSFLTAYILDNPDEAFTVADGGDNLPFRPQGDQPASWTDSQDPTPPSGWIAFESYAWFRADGRRTTPWSDPIPKTAQDITIAVIDSDNGDNFKYDPNTNTRPFDDILLTASLYEGTRRLNDTQTVTYLWKRVRNGQTVEDVTMGTSETLSVNHSQVDQIATFELTQTLSDGKGNTWPFVKRIEIKDTHDGINARNLVVKRHADIFIKKGGSYTPSEIRLEAFAMNITPGTNDYVWSYRNELEEVAEQAWNTIADTTKEVIITGNDPFSGDDFEAHLGANSSYVNYRVQYTAPDGSVFTDEAKISHMDLQDGVAAYFAALSNDFVQIAVNASGVPLSTDLPGMYYTDYKVYDSAGADVSASYTLSYTVVKDVDSAMSGADITASFTIDSGAKRFKLNEWGKGVKEVTVEMLFHDPSDTLPDLHRQWRLRRLLNGAEIVLVADIDITDDSPSKGFAFAPTDNGLKRMEAVAYVNGVQETDYTGYTFEWEDDNGFLSTTRFQEITKSSVNIVDTVKVKITHPAGYTSLGKVTITEIQDATGLLTLYHHGGINEEPALPAQAYSDYEPQQESLLNSTWQGGNIFWLDYDSNVSDDLIIARAEIIKNGGASWKFVIETASQGVQEIGSYSAETLLLYDGTAFDAVADGIIRIGIKPDKTATTPKIYLNFNKNTASQWTTRLIPNFSRWRSENRTTDDPTDWSDPYLFVGEEGEIGKPGFGFPTFMAIVPNKETFVSPPGSSVLPEVPGTQDLVFSFKASGYTWYSEGNVPDYNHYTHSIWITSKMVRFDVNDNYVSSSADPWTVPRRIGGTDGLPGEQPVMIFRRSLTKPAGSDLPVNGQIFESSGGPKWAISPPIGGSGRIWMCFAVWTYDSINSKYIQKTNWSDPTPFEAQDTRTIYAYHGPTNGDLIPSPPTDDPQAVYEAGMNYSKNGWTKTTRSDTRFKAEAYFNNGWSPWLITRQGGQAGKDGKDGSLWYLYETIKSSGTITKEADDKRGWFEANYGKLGDYAIKTTGEVYRRTDNPSIGRWTYALDLAQAWWAYDQLGAYQVASTSFRSSIGQVGDWTMKPDGTLYQKKTSVQWEKKGTMAFSISTDKLWAFDAYKVTASNGDPNYESWDFRLRRDTAGIVHYVLKWYRNGGSRRNVVFYIPDPWASQLKPLPLSLSAGAHVREMLLPGKIVDDLGAPITETPFAKIFYNEPLNRIELTATFINDHTCYCAGSYPADGVSGWG